MAVNTGISKSLFVNTNANVLNHKEETSTMLLLLNAIAEAKNRNIKKAIVEFNQSFIESKENEELFSSKLLELNYQDLEILFLCLCGPEKNRRSSKQHEKRTSLKKKSSVGDLSFSNGGFENESRSTYLSNSLGRKRGQVVTQEENKKNCLRKAFYLRRDFYKADLHHECFHTILNLHLKVENYYPCVLLFTEEEMKQYHEHLICTLDDSQKFKIYQLCIFVASNVTEKQSDLSKPEITSCIQHCRLACKLLPNEEKPYELLCKIHRKANEIENALAVISTYFDEVDINSIPMLLQKLLCLVDLKETQHALSIASHVLATKNTTKDLTLIEILRGFLFMLRKDIASGVNLFQTYTIDNNKAIMLSVLIQLKCEHLQMILKGTKSYFQNLVNESTEKNENDPDQNNLNEIKKFLMLTAQLLSVKNPGDLAFSKLYVDYLYLCGESELAQACLVRLVKEHPAERLPMVYLANLRLKLGAYIAATEDFRTLYVMWGFQNLSEVLFTLPMDDRTEIARVHRLHGFRYIKNEQGFKESSECFSVALCAIGLAATGLLLSRGLCYMHLNDFEQASDDFNRCLETDNTISAALCARAVLYAATTHVQEAILNFRRAFTIDSNACQQCLAKLPSEHVLIFAQLISQYIKQELWNIIESRTSQFDLNEISESHQHEFINAVLDKEMLRYNEFLCKVFPTNTDYTSTYIQCLYISKEYHAALYETNNALTLFPNEPCFHAWKAVLLIHQRKFDDAITQLKDVKKCSDDITRILSHLDKKSQRQVIDKVMRKATSSNEQEKYGEAILYFNIVAMVNNKDVDALRGRLECYYKIGEMKKWLQDLSKVIQLQPLTVDLCLRARHYQTQGDDIRACEDYMHALDLEEEQTVENITVNSNGEEVVELFHTCAWCMIELEKPREVFRLSEAGLKFDPTHKGLKQLKDKTKSHVNKCVIQ